jgi:hypothetical protein
MLDSLDQMKLKADRYDLKDPNFVDQVRDLENHMHFNRAPPLSTMADQPGAMPYQRVGPATTFAAP